MWIIARDCVGESCSPPQQQPVLRSTADAGRAWTRYDLGPISPAAVQFATHQRGWLYAWDGVRQVWQQLLTEDGGQSWIQIQ
ncbi:MAG: hypothetical protein HY329_27655 [Chloroflexi bacterium]|nr:hypothetical protein [Chloroflexota bacterium]